MLKTLLLAFGLIVLGSASASAQGCGSGNPGCLAPTPPIAPCDSSNRIATTSFVAACGTSGATTTTLTGLITTYGGCIADWKNNIFRCKTPGLGTTDYGSFTNMYTTLVGSGTGSSKSCYNVVGTLVYFAANTPAQPCYRGDGALLGWLTEQQTTNNAKYSEQFDNAAWVKTNVSVVKDTSIAPDGNITADTITENTSTGMHAAIQTITKAASAQTWTNTCFFSPGAGIDNVLVYIDDNAGNGAYVIFNPADGTIVVDPTAIGTGFTVLSSWSNPAGSSGMWRLGLTATTNTATTLRFACGLASGISYSYAGDGASSAIVWGAQAEEVKVGSAEEATFPSSYIPTTSAAVVRAVDLYTLGIPTGVQNMPFGIVAVQSMLGGTNYVVGEKVTLAGGPGCTTNPIVQISTIAAGGVPVAATIVESGQCKAIVADPLLQASTTGAGTGASFIIDVNWGQEASLVSDVFLPPAWNNASGTFEALLNSDLSQRIVTTRSSSTVIGLAIVGKATGILVTSGSFNNNYDQEYVLAGRIQDGSNAIFTSFGASNTSSGKLFPTAALSKWKFGAYSSGLTTSDRVGHLIEAFIAGGVPNSALSAVSSIGTVINPDLPITPPGYLTEAMVSSVSPVGLRVEQTGSMIPSDTPDTNGTYHIPMSLNISNFASAKTQATTTASLAKYSFGVWGNKCDAPGGIQSATQCPGGYSVTVGGTTFAYSDSNPNSYGPEAFSTTGAGCLTLYSTYALADAATRVFIDAAFGYAPTVGDGTGYLERAAAAGLTVINYATAESDCASANEIALSQSLGGAGNLTLNGSAVTAGTATIPVASPVLITSTGNDTGITYTVTGTASGGGAQTDVVTGPCGATGCTTFSPTVYTPHAFKTVTQVALSGATGGTVTVGADSSYFSQPCIAPGTKNTKCTVDVGILPITRPIDGTVTPDGANCDCEFADGRPTAMATTLMQNIHNDLVNAPASPYTGPPWNGATPVAPPVGGYKWRVFTNDPGGRGGFCGNATQPVNTGCLGQAPNLNTIINNYVDEINIWYRDPPSVGHTLSGQIQEQLCLLSGQMWPCNLSSGASFPHSKVTVEAPLGVWPSGSTPTDMANLNADINTYSLGGVAFPPIYAQFGGARNSAGQCRWTIQKICNAIGLVCGTCP